MSGDKTSLGDRMKHNYEDRTRYYLPRRTHVIIRLDGKAFHSYTHGLEKPFDHKLSHAMWAGAGRVMNEIQGSAFAYHQSDEVSILLTDFNTIKTEAPFDYNIQKLTSISASVMTAVFNNLMIEYAKFYAFFDARVFSIPDRIEVYNYFLWRQRDCIRNSVQTLGQHHFSQKQLHGLSIQQVQDKLLTELGIDWNTAIPDWSRNGTIVYPDYNYQHLQTPISSTQDWFMNLIPVRQD